LIRTTDIEATRSFEMDKEGPSFFAITFPSSLSVPTFAVNLQVIRGTVRYILRVTNYL